MNAINLLKFGVVGGQNDHWSKHALYCVQHVTVSMENAVFTLTQMFICATFQCHMGNSCGKIYFSSDFNGIFSFDLCQW